MPTGRISFISGPWAFACTFPEGAFKPYLA
jgi:hypothetical protein